MSTDDRFTNWQCPVNADGSPDVRVGDVWQTDTPTLHTVVGFHGVTVLALASGGSYFTYETTRKKCKLVSRNGVQWEVPADKRKGRWVQDSAVRGKPWDINSPAIYCPGEACVDDAPHGAMVWLPDAPAIAPTTTVAATLDASTATITGVKELPSVEKLEARIKDLEKALEVNIEERGKWYAVSVERMERINAFLSRESVHRNTIKRLTAELATMTEDRNKWAKTVGERLEWRNAVPADYEAMLFDFALASAWFAVPPGRVAIGASDSATEFMGYRAKLLKERSAAFWQSRVTPMAVCPTCGNKRCAKATDATAECKGSAAADMEAEKETGE